MKRILRVTAAMGLSSLLTVALGAVRYKFIAVELGAPGVGLLGILTTAMTLSVVLFSLGLNTSGVQATAAAVGDDIVLHRARAALLVGSRWLGGAGGIVVTIMGLTLGRSWLPDETHPMLVVWLGVALAANVISGAQLALLNGTGNIRALVKSNAWGAVVGTIVTIAAIYASGQAGLIAALAAAPIATLAYSTWFLHQTPETRPRPRFSVWWPDLRGMLMLGGAVTLGLLLSNATQLIVRLWLQRSEGLLSAGYFQASWTITNMYLGFVLMGLAAEYYPRISAQSNEPSRLNTSVDDQTRLALLLGAPVLLWMMVLAPLVLHLLYAEDFQVATSILRWQLFGDILKIVGWAVGFLLLARKARGAFLLAEIGWNVSYLALALTLPLRSTYGLTALGAAYAGAYALYVLFTLWLAHRETGFILLGRTVSLILALLVAGAFALWGVESESRTGLYAAVVVASGATVASGVVLLRWRSRERRAESEVDLPI